MIVKNKVVKSKPMLLILVLIMFITSVALIPKAAWAASDGWVYDGKGTGTTTFSLVKGNERVGTFCVAVNVLGLDGSYEQVSSSDTNIASKLKISDKALKEMRYAIAEMKSNYIDDIFSYKLAEDSFPSETLQRSMGRMFTQNLVWNREYLDNSKVYPAPDDFTPMTQSEKDYFYKEPLELDDKLDVEMVKASPETTDGKFWGPYKIQYTLNSVNSLIEINNSGKNKDVLPTFSLKEKDLAQIYDGKSSSSKRLKNIHMGEEFYLKPIKTGNNQLTFLPDSTIITGIEEEYLFENTNKQPQYGLVFSEYDGELKIDVDKTTPVDEHEIEKSVSEYKGSILGDYHSGIEISSNSSALFKIDIAINNPGGMDILLPEENSSQGAIPIYTAEQLASINSNLNADYILMNNINLENYLSFNDWKPIGTTAKPFTGTFDGNGKTISNLKINSSINLPTGLFGESAGKIKNLALRSFHIEGKNYVGGIVGRNEVNGSTIENCIVADGTLAGTGYVGGVAGKTVGNITKLSASDVNISGEYYVGGLVGGSASSFISNCNSNNIEIFADGQKDFSVGVGGLVGAVVSDTGSKIFNIENCKADNLDIKASSSSGIGGIVGQCEYIGYSFNGSSINIKNTSVTNSKIDSWHYAGGILGSSESIEMWHDDYWNTVKFKANISNCNVNNVRLTGSLDWTGYQEAIGGIAGAAYNITSCYANVEITTEYQMGVGGIVGFAGGDVIDCRSDGKVTRKTTKKFNYSYYTSGIAAEANVIKRCITSIDFDLKTGKNVPNSVVDIFGGIAGRFENIENCVNASNTINGPTYQYVYKIGSNALNTKTNLSFDRMIVSPNVKGAYGENAENGLAVDWNTLTNKTTYTDKGYDFSAVWKESTNGGLPELQSTEIKNASLIGSTVVVAKDSDGIWARAAVTGYLTDSFNGSNINTKNLLNEKLEAYDEDGGTVLVPVAEEGKLTLYYLAESLPEGEYLNKVSLNLKSAEAIVNVKDDVKNQKFYIDAKKFADEIRNPLVGSEFTLYKYNSQVDYTGTLENKGIIIPENDTPIEVTEPGYYMIKETKVPNGFVMDATEYRFVFNGSEFKPETILGAVSGDFEFEVKDNTISMVLNNINISEVPKANTGQLKISKHLIGGMANEEFAFEVIFSDENNNILNDKYEYKNDDNSINGTIKSGDIIKLKGGQDITIRNIPKGVKYKVKEIEENQNGYNTTYTNESGEIGTGLSEAKCFNTKGTNVNTGEISIKKEVKGKTGDLNRKFSFKVILKDTNNNELTDEFDFSLANGNPINKIKSGDIFQLAHNDSGIIVGIPVGTTFEVTEIEENSDGYDTSYENKIGVITIEGIQTTVTNEKKIDEEKPVAETEDNKKSKDKIKIEKSNVKITRTGDKTSVFLLLGIFIVTGATMIIVRKKIQ